MTIKSYPSIPCMVDTLYYALDVLETENIRHDVMNIINSIPKVTKEKVLFETLVKSIRNNSIKHMIILSDYLYELEEKDMLDILIIAYNEGINLEPLKYLELHCSYLEDFYETFKGYISEKRMLEFLFKIRCELFGYLTDYDLLREILMYNYNSKVVDYFINNKICINSDFINPDPNCPYDSRIKNFF